MYGMFPRLKERQHTEAGVLSGGEQQMLTLCRTLMGDPDLIMIDEPTEGLAPKIVELVAEYLRELKRSDTCSAMVSFCSTSSTDTPRRFNSRRYSATNSTILGARPSVGSSIMIRSGSPSTCGS